MDLIQYVQERTIVVEFLFFMEIGIHVSSIITNRNRIGIDIMDNTTITAKRTM